MEIAAMKVAKTTLEAELLASIKKFEKATLYPVTTVNMSKNGGNMTVGVTTVVSIAL